MNLREDINRIKKIMDLSNKDEIGQEIYDGILVGGLDYRKDSKGNLTDKPLSVQVDELKKGFGLDKNIKGFRYNHNTTDILEFLKLNRMIHIFLFSAGCVKSYDISNSPNVDKNKIYIIEPFNSANNKIIITNTVNNGVPAHHVFVGENVGTGLGIVDGSVPSGAKDHWSALKLVGQKVK